MYLVVYLQIGRPDEESVDEVCGVFVCVCVCVCVCVGLCVTSRMDETYEFVTRDFTHMGVACYTWNVPCQI